MKRSFFHLISATAVLMLCGCSTNELEQKITPGDNPQFTAVDAIRWEALDADMHITSFFETSEPDAKNDVAEMFKQYPWLNVSEVARYIGINKSLLARYIYGISKPSAERLNQIRETFHEFGRQLQYA